MFERLKNSFRETLKNNPKLGASIHSILNTAREAKSTFSTVLNSMMDSIAPLEKRATKVGTTLGKAYSDISRINPITPESKLLGRYESKQDQFRRIASQAYQNNPIAKRDPHRFERKERQRARQQLQKGQPNIPVEAAESNRIRQEGINRKELIEKNRQRSQELRSKYIKPKALGRRLNQRTATGAGSRQLHYNNDVVKRMKGSEQGKKLYDNFKSNFRDLDKNYFKPTPNTLNLKSPLQKKALANESKTMIAQERWKNASPSGFQTPLGFNQYPVSKSNINGIRPLKGDTSTTSSFDKALSDGRNIKNHINDPNYKPPLAGDADVYSRLQYGLGSSPTAPNGTMIDDKGVSKLSNSKWNPFNKNTNPLDDYARLQRNEYAKSVRTLGHNVDPFNETHAAKQQYKIDEMRKRAQAIVGKGGIDEYLKQNRKDFTSEYKELLKGHGEWKGRANVNEAKLPDDVRSKLKDLDQKESKYNAKIQRDVARYNRLMDGTFGKAQAHIDFEYKKTYWASEGTSGYGLGMKNFMQASRVELGARALSFANPFNGSGWEALKNSFGIMTQGQRTELNRAMKGKNYFARLMTPGMQAVIGGYGVAAFSVVSDGDLGEMITNQVSYAAGLQGWRVGSSVGGMMAKGTLAHGSNVHVGKGGKSLLNVAKSGVTNGLARGALGVAGGVTGFALGSLLVQAGSDTIRDLVSNNSAIAKVAKNFSTRSTSMNIEQNRQTLTSRQAALHKLSKSGLNDRAMLLGNEARVMRGLI